MTSEWYETGKRIRTEVLGKERVEKVLDKADDFNQDFQEFLTEYCWGRAWGGPALNRKQRSLLNLGMLAALNRGPEFETHFRGALSNGLTIDELKDACLQIPVYCGIPAGVEAHRLGTKALAAMGEAGELPDG